MLEIINSFLPADYLLIMAGLVVIGEMLKKFTVLPNYLLTTVLPVLGAIVMSITYTTSVDIFVAADLMRQIMIGLVLGWASTGGYEWFANTFIKKEQIIKTINKETKTPQIVETVEAAIDPDDIEN